jgi:uncharacterized membrane protein
MNTQYDESRPLPKGWTAISALLYLAYGGFFVYVTWSMRRMNAVHSRIGVTFTALVEIAVSTITSVSVCALVGFKVTMVPWYFLLSSLNASPHSLLIQGTSPNRNCICWR